MKTLVIKIEPSIDARCLQNKIDEKLEEIQKEAQIEFFKDVKNKKNYSYLSFFNIKIKHISINSNFVIILYKIIYNYDYENILDYLDDEDEEEDKEIDEIIARIGY